jgi:adenylate cyclase
MTTGYAPAPVRVPLLIVFVELTNFRAEVLGIDDLSLAGLLGSYYELVARTVSAAGGTVVKFIGDGALLVFPETSVDVGVRTLLRLRTVVDVFMTESECDCRLAAKVHFGVAVTGAFGPADDKRFDVLGSAVIAAAMLPSGRIALSSQAFDKLSHTLRTDFVEQASTDAHSAVWVARS